MGHARQVRTRRDEENTSAPSGTRRSDTSVGEPPQRRLRERLFGRAAEGHLPRRTSDWIRVAVGVVALLITARHAGDVSATEQALYDLVASVPRRVDPVFLALYRLGVLWAIGILVVAVLVARRWRLARDLVVAGVVTSLAARLMGEIVVAHSTFGGSLRAATRFGTSQAFPSVRVAVVVAVISTAGPYVTRPTRVIGRVIVVALAVAALDLGRAYPNDLVAAVILGWTVAAAVHLLFGSPGGRPTVEQVRRALAQLDVNVHNLRLADTQPSGSTLMYADDDDGNTLRVKVIGRDETDARFLAKAWRVILYRDSGTPLTLTRLHQLEREAYLMLVARDAGVRVPKVLVVADAGAGSTVLVVATVGAVPLAALEASDVTDTMLEEAWANVATLHRVRVAHGSLDAQHVLVSDDGPWIVGFDGARATAASHHRALDIANLLAATAAVVGETRAVQAAVNVLGQSTFATALPFLQPAALSRATRAISGGYGPESQSLARLRELGAAAAHVDAPRLTQVRRIDAVDAAMALGGLIAVAVLLNDVGDPGDVWATIRSADWSWIGVALLASFASNIGYAVGLMGTVPIRLPLWPTTEVQIAMSFSNLAVPAVGGQGMQVRFLQKMGVDLPSAIAAGGVLSAAGSLVAALGLFVLALAVEPSQADFSLLPTTGLVELLVGVVIVVAVASAVVLAVPRFRGATLPPVRRAVITMRTALLSPRRFALLIGGYVLATLLSTWCLQACLVAFGGSVSYWSLLAVNIGVVTVASIVPIPGGGTAVGTVGLSAALVAFGVPEQIAVATALSNQLVYYYLPAIPGWFATKNLIRRDYL
jgi:undecaprenyl-diphosphatase